MSTRELLLDDHRLIDAGQTYRAFQHSGYVLFERAVPPDIVGQMRTVFDEYFTPFTARRPGRKRFLMHLPFKAPLYDPLFIEHPLVLDIVDRALGKDCICGYFSSETPLPGAEMMKAHFDLAFVKRMTALNHPLAFVNRLLGSAGYYYGIQVSLALVDSHADNAPFEIWPGTNRLSLRRSRPSAVLMPAGSLLVRDVRNLHRGTPHHGAGGARPFLSLVFLRPWVPGWKPPEIPLDVYNTLSPRARHLFRRASIGQDVPSPEAWASRSR